MWGFPESSPHNVFLLTLLQELLESRLKVLKKDLEDYEAFRSTEEKESKELLVRMATLRLAPPSPTSCPRLTTEGHLPPWLGVFGFEVCACGTEVDFRNIGTV